MMNLTLEELKILACFLSYPMDAYKVYTFEQKNRLYQRIDEELKSKIKQDSQDLIQQIDNIMLEKGIEPGLFIKLFAYFGVDNVTDLNRRLGMSQ